MTHFLLFSRSILHCASWVQDEVGHRPIEEAAVVVAGDVAAVDAAAAEEDVVEAVFE